MNGHLLTAVLLLSIAPLHPGAATAADGKKPLELVDLMKLRQIEDTVISDDGAWIAYSAVPDRGDATLVVARTDGRVHHKAERGRAPRLTPDGSFAAARLEVLLAEREAQANDKDGEDGEGPQPGLVLLSTADGGTRRYERVQAFAFSADGRWLVRHHTQAKTEDAGEGRVRGATTSEAETIRSAAQTGEGETETRQCKTGEVEAVSAAVPPPGVPVSTPETAGPRPKGPDEAIPDPSSEEEELGADLVLLHLASGEEIRIAHVIRFAVDDIGRFLAYAVRAPGGVGNGVFVRPFDRKGAVAVPVHQEAGADYFALVWTRRPAANLAFVIEPAAGGEHERSQGTTAAAAKVEKDAGKKPPAETEPPDTTLVLWDGDTLDGSAVTTSAAAPAGWYLPAENELAFSHDGERLFFGYRPLDLWQPPPDNENEGRSTLNAGASADDDNNDVFEPYDVESILEDRTVDVWHVNDPLIQTNQRSRWEEEKKRLYLAVAHVGRGDGSRQQPRQIVFLAGTEVRVVDKSENPHAVLGRADVPYLRERTWDGWYHDLYWISLADGHRRLVAKRHAGAAALSPDGRWVVYYKTPDWYLWDSTNGQTQNLTAALKVGFANEDHDYPRPASSYGVADWHTDGSAVLLHDKFDVWCFPTHPGAPATAAPESAEQTTTEAATTPWRLTVGRGRTDEIRFRLLDLDPERDGISSGEPLLLSGYDERQKNTGLYRAQAAAEGITPALVVADETVRCVARARDADRLLLTRESYTRFPDLWSAPYDRMDSALRLSAVNPEINDYAWGETKLVSWRDLDGQELDGVLITPAGRKPGQRLPVLVYFYRFFSPRLHRFNEPAVSHRPSFPFYASHGYAVFLPDIHFEIGRPGLSATKALVPGVQKLISMGVADPEAIGLHGHSWSGYQTAFVVTQTNIFKAAVAGAPVTNMTSAYGGIRWGSGLARQFQYEMGQSRLGASLWQARDRYIDNSPLFFADRIETPLLIMHGDEDEAVPWYQSIEFYLALRRLGKDAVFLQYRGEPHHPKKYANKLDYSIKMKAFFDHHLKGEPAPEWLATGVPYSGE